MTTEEVVSAARGGHDGPGAAVSVLPAPVARATLPRPSPTGGNAHEHPPPHHVTPALHHRRRGKTASRAWRRGSSGWREICGCWRSGSPS